MASSFWIEEARPQPSPEVPDLNQDIDVLVVGAGIVGLTTATALVAQGRKVGLIDASQVGTGVTGQSTAKVTIGTGLRIDAVNRRHGRDAAAQYMSAGTAGLEWVRAHLSSGASEKSQTMQHTLYSTSAKGTESLHQHQQLVESLGVRLDAQTGNTPTHAMHDVSYRDQLIVQPVDYLSGLLTRLIETGNPVWTDLAVLDVHDDHVRTASGTIRAEDIVVTTHAPLGYVPATLPWQQQRHYAAVVRSAEVAPMALDIDGGWSTRPIVGHDDLSLVLGGSHATGAEDSDPTALVDRLAEWVKATLSAEVVSWWSSQDVMSSDDVPFVGRTRPGNSPWTATGFGGWGFAHGTAAALDLANRISGRGNLWDFWSLTPSRLLGMVPDMGRNAVTATTSWASRTFHQHTSKESPIQLHEGEAEVVSTGGRSVARSVASDGVLREINASCSHMGCLVQWNAAEESWDCPCHGSRFTPGGAVLHGPATQPLEAVTLEPQG